MRSPVLAALSALLLLPVAAGQQAPPFDPADWTALSWQDLGPDRGGRSCAVSGVHGDRDTYYMGSTGGGVWRTDDGGGHWRNVSDGSFGGSIGAVAVAPSDPQVIWVGTGEKTIRGNVSHGDGVWRSTDGARTWTHVGLADSRHVCRLRVHPHDPDTAWAAALGHLYGPNAERGVFKTTDGGATWRRVLHVSDEAGAVDLSLDPSNPRILYASLWNVDRTPWGLNSGGPGSGLWRSRDGGETWDELSDNPGFPEGPLGIIGVSVSPVDPDRVYAMVEAAEGGLLVSEDGGATWRRRNDETKLRQRAWYYSRVVADPAHVDQVWVLNVRLWRSRDGGSSFEPVSTPHGDNHDLWIDPADPLRMIESNDGGANVSVDGGRTWSRQDNQPTAQLYRVSADDAFPYRLLAGQQDNSALRLRSRSPWGGRPGLRDWEPTAGGESGHVVALPGEPDVVFGGSYGGYLARLDHRTGEVRRCDVWPDNPMGWGTRELAYRFQWNFPLFVSPHAPHALYAAANVLFRSTDQGASWTALSPDLTRDDPDKQGSSGGPITQDNTGVEYHATIFAALESPHEPGVLWCGSDDGLVHVSRDDGATWTNVTPLDLPKWAQVNSLEAHPTRPGGLYLAATAYKLDDLTPYLFRTDDYGASWTRIDDGIPRDHFTRVLRADPDRVGLLYAGTERGVYVSLDDGTSWSSLQNDLPTVPVTDLLVKQGELVAATQGRGFWVLRDLAPLHTWEGLPEGAPFVLFPPREAVRARGHGLTLSWFLAADLEPGATRRMELLDGAGRVLHTLEDGLAGARGLNRRTWDLSLADAERFDGMVLWNGDLGGPRLVPGDYVARLTLGDAQAEVGFRVVADPRTAADPEDLRAQFDFLLETRDLLSEVHRAIRDLRAARTDVASVRQALETLDANAHEATIARARELEAALTAVEETLYQTRSRSSQDPLNHPIRLNDKLAGLRGVVAQGDRAPTAQAHAVRAELEAAIRTQLEAWETLVATDLPALDAAARDAGVPLVRVPARERTDGVD